MDTNHYTYYLAWSSEDGEHVGRCAEFPALSWLSATPDEALEGIRKTVCEVVDDMRTNGEAVPEARQS
ncbi:HicB [Pandoraea commovens]|uniref:HicB n=1 Tax=Pandoraea commovens TaxID=2508289 RepID=A0A5E4TMI4_9BURK|nr:HicB [Pandoraea commovens]